MTTTLAPNPPLTRKNGAYEPPNYLRPNFPLLSFLYALYCDHEFSRNEYVRWLKARLESGDYREYLDPYVLDARGLPDAVDDLIAVDVEKGGKKDPLPKAAMEPTIKNQNFSPATFPDTITRYLPTDAMAEKIMPHFWGELSGRPLIGNKVTRKPVQIPGPRKLPSPNPADKRRLPLLCSLAAIYLHAGTEPLNPDFTSGATEFLKDYALNDAVRRALLELAHARKLTAANEASLAPTLVKELTGPPACW